MTKSKRTNQLQLSAFDRVENNKKWPMLGHKLNVCLLSSLCLLTAALMSLGSSSKPLKPNEVVGRCSVAMTVLRYTTSIPGTIYFSILQTDSARREKELWSMSQKSCQSAGNQFSPCTHVWYIKEIFDVPKLLGRRLLLRTTAFNCAFQVWKLNTFEDSLEKVIPLLTVPLLSFQTDIA